MSIGVASQRVVVRQVDIPYMSPQDRAKALPLMVADQIPMPVDDAVLDFVPLEQVPGVDGATVARGLLVAAAEGTHPVHRRRRGGRPDRHRCGPDPASRRSAR